MVAPLLHSRLSVIPFGLANALRLPATALFVGGLLLSGCQCDPPAKDKPKTTTDDADSDPSMDGTSLAVAPPEEPPELPAAIPTGQLVFTTTPTCEKADCPLTIKFGEPMAKSTKDPLPKFAMRPVVEGEWKWSDTKSVTFTPKPGALGHGVSIEIDLRPFTFDHDGDEETPDKEVAARTFYTRVPYLRIGVKVAYWPVEKDNPRVVLANQAWSGMIGQGAMIIGYDQPVVLETIKSRASVSYDNSEEDINYQVRRPLKSEFSFDHDVASTHFIAIALDKGVEDGEQVVVEIPNGKNTDSYRLEVTKKFRVDNVRSDGGSMQKVGVWGGVHINFTSPISLERMKAGVNVTPAPKALNLSVWGNQLNINGTFEHGTDYKIDLDSSLKDALGNTLSRRKSGPKLAFRTRDLSPRMTMPTGPVVLEHGHDKLGVRITNVDAVTATLTPVPRGADFAKALNVRRLRDCNLSGAEGSMAPLSANPKLKMNEKGTAEFEATEPGLYCASLTTVGRGSQARDRALRGATLVQVTALNAMVKVDDRNVFAWVTRIKDGKPVSGATVAVLSAERKVLGRGVSGANGTVQIKTTSGLKQGTKSGFLVVSQEGKDLLVSQISPRALTNAWQFGQKESVPGVKPLRAALFSERGVYRPGENVHLQFIAHPDVVDAALGGSNKLTLTINDSRGRKVKSKSITLNAFHSGTYSFKLGKEANVGRYTVLAKVAESTLTSSFRVEEYRVPTFEVRMSSPQKRWERASDIEVLVDSRYMHGARMPGRELSYTVTREPKPFVSDAFPTFTFGVAGAELSASTVLSKSGRLDGMGQKAIAFSANHPSHAGPMRYVVDANVTDVDRQVYAGRMAKTVHAARFYVGVQKPSQTVVKVGDTVDVAFAAVFTNGKPMSGAKLKARLERVDHHQTARIAGETESGDTKVEVENHAVETKLKTCNVVTKRGKAKCKFVVPTTGQYRVRVWARDKSGRDVQAGYQFFSTGQGVSAWPRYERARIDVVSDKMEYTPGDVAKLVVESPFDVATGLLTIERDGVRSSKLFNIDKDTPALEVPITEDMAPNVFASVVLTRGRIHDKKDATGFETGAPSFRLGVVNLKVRPDKSMLSVEVSPSRRAAGPGQTISIDVGVKDAAGSPANAQVTLMVVDEAVLGMTRYRTPDVLSALNRQRGWDVRTLLTLADMPNARRARKESMFPGGDGGDGLSIAEFPAELRKLFDSTALFAPALVTDASGKVTAEVTFPDNLTTYRIMALVVDKEGRAGHADKRIKVRKPLMVQPVLPRFVYPGDSLKIEALVVNGSDEEGDVTLVTEVEGATTSGDKKQGPKTLEHGQENLFGTALTVPKTVVARPGTEVVIRFAGTIKTKSGKTFKDAVEKRIPVLSPGTKRSSVVSKAFSGEASLEVPVTKDRVKDSLKVEVVASATMLTELKDAVNYLMRYPNGCIEQTTSTAYPLVLLEDLLPEIGVEVNKADLRKFRDAGIKRLLSFQTSKGGLSYWPGEDKPHAFGTAFGLTALLEAKKKGLPIPKDKLDRMANFLIETLKKQNVTETIAHGGIADADSRALFVMTLGRMGRPQHSHVGKLWSDVDKLGPFGLSFLATAIQEGAGDKALLQPVLDKIKGHAEIKDAEAYFEGKRKGGYSMDSPLRSHAGALLAYATAAPGAPLTGQLLKGLLARRRGGMWGNTQENVFGMMAVAKLSRSQEAAGGKATPTITIGGKAYAPDDLEEISSRVKRLVVKGDKAGVTGDGATTINATVDVSSPSFVTLRAEWEAALTDDNRAARSNGFVIKRTYETESGSSVAPDSVKLGSVVRVRLTVKTDRAYNYVALDDKLPAGMEPMNLNLATTAKASLGKMTAGRKAGDRVLSFQEMRDHRVAFYADELPPGTYEFVYLARATIPGTFIRPASHAEAMYETDRNGDTEIDVVTIR